MRVVPRAIIDSERGTRHADVEPKDAATLIVLDRSGTAPSVLLGKRHARHVFMPEKFVFPGGRVDAADRVMPAAKPLDALTERRLIHESAWRDPEGARALALTAIRETFEETGMLIGTPGSAPGPDVPPSWEGFVRSGYLPDPSALQFIARAVTPPGFHRRYDARFFCVDAGAVVRHLDGVVHADAELTELAWLPIEEAMDLDLPVITAIVLQELQARLAKDFAPSLPVPFYGTNEGDFLREMIA
jgi:8-oxo-dGTP pyrophosphatase MutT (NUDIX family)